VDWALAYHGFLAQAPMDDVSSGFGAAFQALELHEACALPDTTAAESRILRDLHLLLVGSASFVDLQKVTESQSECI